MQNVGGEKLKYYLHTSFKNFSKIRGWVQNSIDILIKTPTIDVEKLCNYKSRIFWVGGYLFLGAISPQIKSLTFPITMEIKFLNSEVLKDRHPITLL